MGLCESISKRIIEGVFEKKKNKKKCVEVQGEIYLDCSPRFWSDQVCEIPFSAGKITEHLIQKFLKPLSMLKEDPPCSDIKNCGFFFYLIFQQESWKN